MRYSSAWQAHRNHQHERSCWYCQDLKREGTPTYRFIRGPYMPWLKKPEDKVEAQKQKAKDWYQELMR